MPERNFFNKVLRGKPQDPPNIRYRRTVPVASRVTRAHFPQGSGLQARHGTDYDHYRKHLHIYRDVRAL